MRARLKHGRPQGAEPRRLSSRTRTRTRTRTRVGPVADTWRTWWVCDGGAHAGRSALQSRAKSVAARRHWRQRRRRRADVRDRCDDADSRVDTAMFDSYHQITTSTTPALAKATGRLYLLVHCNRGRRMAGWNATGVLPACRTPHLLCVCGRATRTRHTNMARVRDTRTTRAGCVCHAPNLGAVSSQLAFSHLKGGFPRHRAAALFNKGRIDVTRHGLILCVCVNGLRGRGT
eukprot:7383323-Prymnesium_polylepis.1